ncbi:hypothetical protein AB0M36_01920 [Actinoplanes sp. NPDC051346]|uniref:hypothetical protein n=1 Tax=Actinoplanes sp. NPDC051346 TaxID=3155048 RepID=UPI003427482D
MRTTAFVPIVALGVALLAGCGSDSDAADAPKAGAAPAAPAAARNDAAKKLDDDLRKREQLIADCMKKQGFQYQPNLRGLVADNQVGAYGGPESVLAPVDEVRAFRQKYGFGFWAAKVFPNDPKVAQSTMDPDSSPNRAYHDGLDKARRKAYEEALYGKEDTTKTSGGKTTYKGGCSAEAAEKVPYGPEQTKAEAAASKRAYAKFTSDPEVVGAAQKYADCLKGKGYQVASAKPGDIENSMAEKTLPDAAPAGQPANQAGDQATDPAAAKAALAKDIKAALDDLDCRTEYADLARTKYADTLEAWFRTA